MKIRITESEIEASAEELNASATLRDSFLDALRSAFLKVQRPYWQDTCDDDYGECEPKDDEDADD